MTSSSTKQQSTQQSAPWEAQQPYLQSAFQTAQQDYGKNANNIYSGNQVAQFTPDQLSSFQRMIGYGGNSAGADTSSNVGMSTANAGSSALNGALSGLSSFTPGGGTQSNIDAATAYANNPATDGMIDAAMRDARRSVSEGILPQNERSAALSGNAMSSKSAIQDAIVQRGLADKTADTSANIRGQQFNNGLQLAEQNSEAANQARLAALTGAASAGGSAVNTGVNAIGSGITQQGGLFDLANAGGAGLQQNTQNAIDNSKGMSEYGNSQMWQNLQNLYNIVGGNQWGGQSSGTVSQTSTPSTWSTIGSGLGLASSLLKLSDRRVKTDIRCIGEADNGLPIYLFRYLNDPKQEVHMGFMAQDVEKVRPEAVVKTGGLMSVNYELAST